MITYEIQRAAWENRDRRDTLRAWVLTGVVGVLAIGAVWGLGVTQDRSADKLMAERERCEQMARETILVRDTETGAMHYRCGRRVQP